MITHGYTPSALGKGYSFGGWGAVVDILFAHISSSPSRALPSVALTAVSSVSPTPVTSDSASPAPEWLIIALLVLVGVVIVAMFALTAFSLAAPRSTLKRVLRHPSVDGNPPKQGLLWRLIGRGTRAPAGAGGVGTKDGDKTNDSSDLSNLITPHLVEKLALAAKPAKRTARTTLAIAGFSLLGIIVVAMFGLSGQGVRDLRSQVVAAITTLVTAIAAFYFGTQAAAKGGGQSGSSAPTLRPDHQPGNSRFTVGVKGKYTPSVGGQPLPTVTLTGDELPAGLKLTPSTGEIAGTPEDSVTIGDYNVTLIAHNGILPDATLPLRITVGLPATKTSTAPAGGADAASAGKGDAASAGKADVPKDPETPSPPADQG